MAVTSRDWRLPEHRREAFQRFYSFHLKYRTHPGLVYFLLPDLGRHLWGIRDQDDYYDHLDDLAWMVWVNGNTQNPVTTQLILEEAPTFDLWEKAVAFWNTNFTKLEWDTDRRHQKSKFGEATEKWVHNHPDGPSSGWDEASEEGWEGVWKYAISQPYMGRLSAWSMSEYAKILLPNMPNASTLMLRDKTGSQSHRNGLSILSGFDAAFWPPEAADTLGIVGRLEELGESLLSGALERNPLCLDVGYLTMESALCTYKSWHKPNRRYPNVYTDMHYLRVKRAEKHFGAIPFQWSSRKQNLPQSLLLEFQPNDPGLAPVKQNHYRETGEIPMMYLDWPDMTSSLDLQIQKGLLPQRKDY